MDTGLTSTIFLIPKPARQAVSVDFLVISDYFVELNLRQTKRLIDGGRNPVMALRFCL